MEHELFHLQIYDNLAQYHKLALDISFNPFMLFITKEILAQIEKG